MSTELLITLGAVFLSVALLVGLTGTFLFSQSSGRRRLSELSRPRASASGRVAEAALTDDPEWNRLLNALPTSRGSVKRLRREMALAGFDSAKAGALVSLSELVFPILLGLAPILMLSGTQRWIGAFLGAAIGYFGPGMLLSMRIANRKRQVENGLFMRMAIFEALRGESG